MTDDRKLSVIELDASELIELMVGEHVTAKNRGLHASLVNPLGPAFYLRGEGFFAGLKPEKVAKLLNEGWAEGANKARKIADAFEDKSPKLQDIRRKPRWTEAGDELDRDRLYGGQIESAWRVARREQTQTPQRIRMVGTFGVPGSWAQAEAQWNGIAMLVLTDLLERAGYMVELYAANPTAMTAGDVMGVVRVKDSGEPLCPELISTVFCHVGMMRFLDFLINVHADFTAREDLGSAAEVAPTWELALATGLVEPVEIILPRIANENDCMQVITDVLALVVPEDGAAPKFPIYLSNARKATPLPDNQGWTGADHFINEAEAIVEQYGKGGW